MERISLLSLLIIFKKSKINFLYKINIKESEKIIKKTLMKLIIYIICFIIR